MSPDDLMRKDEVLAYLKISRASLQKLMKARAFPYAKVGNLCFYRRKDIDAFIESHMIQPLSLDRPAVNSKDVSRKRTRK